MGLIRTSASSYEAPDVAPGTYVMTCVGLKPVTIPFDGMDNHRLQWSFSLRKPDGYEVTIEKLTDPAKTGPKSMNWTLLSALIGPETVRPDMDFNEVDVLGKQALGTMGIPMKPDGQPGKFGLVGMVPLPMGYPVQPGPGPAPVPAPVAQVAPAPAPAPAPATVRSAVGAPDDDDDLPF